MDRVPPRANEPTNNNNLFNGVDVSIGRTRSVDGPVNWRKDLMSYDVKNNQFIKDVEFDGYKFRVVFVRLLNYEDEYVIKKVLTLDGQDILDLLRDKFVERLERIVK